MSPRKKHHSPEDFTTIRVSWRTLEKLKELGKKGETYEQIILKLIEKAQTKNQHSSFLGDKYE